MIWFQIYSIRYKLEPKRPKSHSNCAFNGIEVVGWDIWKGGYIYATFPRAYADTIETNKQTAAQNMCKENTSLTL